MNDVTSMKLEPSQETVQEAARREQVLDEIVSDAAKPKRKKFCYMGAPAVFRLELACQHLSKAFGETCYMVGSVLERPDWRDIDVVMIMDDEDFAREFSTATLHSGAWEFDPKWLIMTVAISAWLSEQCGHPVDFKFQPQTHANKMHGRRDGKKRNAVGLRFAPAERDD